MKKATLKTNRLFARLLAVAGAVMMLGGMQVSAEAAARIKKAEYDGYGKVEVDFYGSVRYYNPRVTVTDNTGASYSATVLEIDDDEMEFRINGYKENRTYNFTISGVKQFSDASYGSVRGSVKIARAGWVKDNGTWYYYESDGDLETGWEKIKGKWYYFDRRTGAMQTGWIKDKGKWYYLKGSGTMASSENVSWKGKTYRFNRSGVCLNP